MSIASIMGTGLSALAANQAALKATSTNVANVNTKGYARLDVAFVSRHASGGLAGVQVDVNRVTNAYLASAEMRGAADVSSSTVLSQFMDRAQGLLGDPSNEGTVFATLDPVFSAFGALSLDPASALRRSGTLSDLNTMLNQFSTTQGELTALRNEANGRAISVMEEANSLMEGIAGLNTSIQRSHIGGVSSAEAETEQQRMLDRLSEIMDVRTQPRSLGGVEVRTTDGMLLVDLDAAKLGMSSTTPLGQTYPNIVMIPPRTTNEVAIESHLQGGELKGLLRVRDKDLVDLQLAFGEFAAGAVDAINTAHNAASTVPAAQQLNGQNTGLLDTDRLNFSGRTNVAVIDQDGMIMRNFQIDFDTATITDDQGVSTTFANSVGDMVTALNGMLGLEGSATFTDGRLQIAAGTVDTGIAVSDDPAAPARRGGRGFSSTFGLNDLITKARPLNFATGLSGADPHGFGAGETMTFAIRDANGTVTRTVEYQIGTATSMADLRLEIDTALSGYAVTSFDANGRLTLVPTTAQVASIDVLEDETQRGTTGYSISEMFGLGQTMGVDRANNLQIRTDIADDPNLIATAKADLAGQPANVRVLAPGDGQGALGIEQAGTLSRQFAAAGSLTSQVTSVMDYAARLAGHAGGKAEALASAKAAAESVRNEVSERRANEEGVNIDEELVNMTTYQQAYSAASRLIQAAKDMYDVILQMV